MQAFDSTSWSLVLGAARAVPEERDRFCARYEPVIRAYFSARWRLPVQHDRVSDGSQEVFVRCFQPGGALERVDPKRPAGFRAYLRGLVSNVASEIERRRRRRAVVELGPDSELCDVVGSARTASAAFDHAWAAMVTAEAWRVVAGRMLTKREGSERLAVLRMRYVDGIKPREIQRELGFEDVDDVYRIIATGRYQFRIAMLSVMASYYPDLSPLELEEKCQELTELL